nr:hypothetical protein Iba_chr13fCG5500 [Ipomoea batatas]
MEYGEWYGGKANIGSRGKQLLCVESLGLGHLFASSFGKICLRCILYFCFEKKAYQNLREIFFPYLYNSTCLDKIRARISADIGLPEDGSPRYVWSILQLSSLLVFEKEWLHRHRVALLPVQTFCAVQVSSLPAKTKYQKLTHKYPMDRIRLDLHSPLMLASTSDTGGLIAGLVLEPELQQVVSTDLDSSSRSTLSCSIKNCGVEGAGYLSESAENSWPFSRIVSLVFCASAPLFLDSSCNIETMDSLTGLSDSDTSFSPALNACLDSKLMISSP